MTRIPVKSSNIKSIGYDAAKELLEVEFAGERVYRYHGVGEDLHSGLMSAKSHGGFLYENISARPFGRPLFPYERVGE